MCNDYFSWLINSAVHINDQLVLEANVGTFEEVAVLEFESSEERIWDLVLNICWKLIVEVEFFDD